MNLNHISTPGSTRGDEKLSIFIPTFNRPELLLTTIASLASQLPSFVSCHVIDNCSDEIMSEVVQKRLGQEIFEKFIFHRNRLNIGGNANICRCFEWCETEWIWILGDDDGVIEDGVAQVIRFISEAEDSVSFINLGNGHLQRPLICDSPEEALKVSGSFGRMICLPFCLYRLSHLRPFMRHAFQWLSLCAPQLMLVLKAHESRGGKIEIRPESVRRLLDDEPYRGSGLTIAWCTAAFAYLPVSCVDMPILRRLLVGMITPRELIYEVRIAIALRTMNKRHILRIFFLISWMKYSWWRFPLELMHFIPYFIWDMLRGFPASAVGDLSVQSQDRT